MAAIVHYRHRPKKPDKAVTITSTVITSHLPGRYRRAAEDLPDPEAEASGTRVPCPDDQAAAEMSSPPPSAGCGVEILCPHCEIGHGSTKPGSFRPARMTLVQRCSARSAVILTTTSQMSSPPTAREYAGVHRVDAVCPVCNRWRELDLKWLISTGQGDIPLISLPLRCEKCGQRGHKVIVSGRSYGLSAEVLYFHIPATCAGRPGPLKKWNGRASPDGGGQINLWHPLLLPETALRSETCHRPRTRPESQRGASWWLAPVASPQCSRSVAGGLHLRPSETWLSVVIP